MKYYENFIRYKGKVAFIDDNGNQIKYDEIQTSCEDIQKFIGTRNLIISFCENSIGSVLGYVAFLNSGNVPILLKTDIEKQLRANLMDIYEPQYLYLPSSMAKEFKDLEMLWENYGYQLLKTNYKSTDLLHPELALLLTTSGSTGSPKLVRQSYTNIAENAESIAEYLGLDDTERPITMLPMNYTYGLSIINSHLLVGATILLTEKSVMERGFWEFFKENQATSFGGVPYIYEILKKLRFFRMDLPSLRYMTQAGGKLSPELHKEYAEYAQNNGKKFIVMYGQTEATARMSYLPPEKSLEKYGSMGIAIPGGKFSLIDVNGKLIDETDTVGELVYEGLNVTMGYAECRKDLAKEDEWNGRLVTGDMAKRDEEGYYYIVGRKKRFLKIYGNRVNLDEVEGMVKKAFEEMECACAGRDDLLEVFVTSMSEELRKQIKTFLVEQTGLNPAAFSVKYVEEIPKNEAGKTLYSKLL